MPRPAAVSARGVSLEQVVTDLLKESTSWLKRRELLSSLPGMLDTQTVPEKLFASLVSAIAVQILDDRSALSRLGCEVLTKTHKRLRHPESLVPVMACLVKQLANSAFVVSTAASEALMEILNFTPSPCLLVRVASLYDPSASVKVRSSLLRALVLPLKHVTVEQPLPSAAVTAQSFVLDESALLNQSFVSVFGGAISWRSKVVRTLQRVLAVDASAELRVLAKGALKQLQVPVASIRSPQNSPPRSESPAADADIDKALGEDNGKKTSALRSTLKDCRGTLSDKTLAKILSVALETKEPELIRLMSRREDGRRFLSGFQELIQHTFPGISQAALSSRGV